MLALTALYNREKEFTRGARWWHEVRSLAEVVNVVRTRTLSTMGKGQTAAMSRYENDVKGDNERDEREYCYNA